MHPTKLKYRAAAKGHNRYCGPGALSIILGIDTAEAAARLRIWRRLAGQHRPTIRGTGDGEMIDVIMDSGMSVYTAWGSRHNVDWMRETGTLHAPTLNQWMKGVTKDGLYLVAAGRHWFVIGVVGNRRYYCDNIIKEWVNARTHKQVSRRARMQTAYRIEGRAGRPTVYETD